MNIYNFVEPLLIDMLHTWHKIFFFFLLFVLNINMKNLNFQSPLKFFANIIIIRKRIDTFAN